MNTTFELRFITTTQGTFKLVSTTLRGISNRGTISESKFPSKSSRLRYQFPKCQFPKNSYYAAIAFLRIAQSENLALDIPDQGTDLVFSKSTFLTAFNGFKYVVEEGNKSLLTGNRSSWISEMFSFIDDDSDKVAPLLREWFSLSTDKITYNQGKLSGKQIGIFLNEERATSSEIDQIVNSLTIQCDSSVCHTLINGIPVYGTLSTLYTNPEWYTNEVDFTDLSANYRSSKCQMAILCHPSLTGKTVFASNWLRHLLEETPENFLQTQVFVWSFISQNFGGFIPFPSETFFDTIAAMLGIEYSDTSIPSKKATYLASFLEHSPTLFYLDGCEKTFELSSNPDDKSSGIAELFFQLCDHSLSKSFVLATTRHDIRDPFKIPKNISKTVPLPATNYIEIGDFYPDLSKDPAFKRYFQRESFVNNLALQIDFEMYKHLSKSDKDFLESCKEHLQQLSPPDLFPKEEEVELPFLNRIFIDNALRNLVNHPARTLYEILCLCHKPVSVEFLNKVANNIEDEDFSPDEWDAALELLGTASALEQALPAPEVSVHPLRRRYIANGLQRRNPARWVALNRSLGNAYLDEVSDYHPETYEDADFLLLAAIHVCQAGDFDHAYNEICFKRLSKRLKGYAIFYLGRYELAQSVAQTLLGDMEGASSSPLSKEQEIMCIHAYGLCSRFMSQFDTALRFEREAWRMSVQVNSIMAILPVGFNLLRLCHMFGYLKEGGEVERRMLKCMFTQAVYLKNPPDVPKDDMIDGISAVFSILALSILYRTNSVRWAKSLLSIGKRQCRKHGDQLTYLMPAFGRLWHAIALLEMGDWKTCEKAIRNNEWKSDILRYQQTGSFELLAARTFALKAASSNSDDRLKIAADANIYLERAFELSIGFSWWRASANLVAADLAIVRGELTLAIDYAAKVMATKPESGPESYPLLNVEALLRMGRATLAEGNIDRCAEYCQRAEQLARDTDYKLGLHRVSKLRRAARKQNRV